MKTKLLQAVNLEIVCLAIILIFWIFNLFITGCLWSILSGYLSEINAPRYLLVWCGFHTLITISGVAFMPITIMDSFERKAKKHGN